MLSDSTVTVVLYPYGREDFTHVIEHVRGTRFDLVSGFYIVTTDDSVVHFKTAEIVRTTQVSNV